MSFRLGHHGRMAIAIPPVRPLGFLVASLLANFERRNTVDDAQECFHFRSSTEQYELKPSLR